MKKWGTTLTCTIFIQFVGTEYDKHVTSDKTTPKLWPLFFGRCMLPVYKCQLNTFLVIDHCDLNFTKP